MDAQQQKFIIISGIVLLVVGTLIYIFYENKNTSDKFVIPPSTSEYETKLEAYRKNAGAGDAQQKTSKIFTQSDSIYDNGVMIENPEVADQKAQDAKINDAINNSQKKMQEAVNNFHATQSQGQSEEQIIYYKAEGQRTNYHNTKQAVESPEPLSQEPVLSDKEQKKQSIESRYTSINADPILPCVVHTTQVLTNGQTVKVRLTKDVRLENIVIPKNTILYAVATYDRNRVKIKISNVRLGSQYYNLNFTGLGDDGQVGIPLLRDEVKDETAKNVTSEIINQATNVLQQLGGAGRAAGQIARGVNNAQQRQSNQTIKLIDRQKINFINNELL